MVEKAAFEKLYKAYYMRVYSYVMTLAGKTHIAEEITQKHFIKLLLQKLPFVGNQTP